MTNEHFQAALASLLKAFNSAVDPQQRLQVALAVDDVSKKYGEGLTSYWGDIPLDRVLREKK